MASRVIQIVSSKFDPLIGCRTSQTGIDRKTVNTSKRPVTRVATILDEHVLVGMVSHRIIVTMRSVRSRDKHPVVGCVPVPSIGRRPYFLIASRLPEKPVCIGETLGGMAFRGMVIDRSSGTIYRCR